MKSTKRRAAFARRSTRRPTSSWARRSIPALDGVVRVSVVATGIDQATIAQIEPVTIQPRVEAAAAHARRQRPRRSAPRRRPARSKRSSRLRSVNDVEIQPVAAVAVASRSRSSPAASPKTRRRRTSFRRRRSSRPFAPRACRRSRTCRRSSSISCARSAAQIAPPPRAAGNASAIAAGEARRLRHQPARRRAGAEAARPDAAARAAATAPPACALRPARLVTPRLRSRGLSRRARPPGALDPHGRRCHARRSLKTISSISRPFCGGSRTDSWLQPRLRPRRIAAAGRSFRPTRLSRPAYRIAD